MRVAWVVWLCHRNNCRTSRHLFASAEFPWLDVSQTDDFHQFLLFPGPQRVVAHRFCYQIVVRETENRQLLHFFLPRQGNLWVTDGLEWWPEVGLEVPSPCVFCKGDR